MGALKRVLTQGLIFIAALHGGVTYDEAKAACMDDNSELINLDSMDKFLALTNFIESSGIDSGMSGGRRVAGHRPTDGGLFDFVLENGEPFPFREDSPAWKLPNQPNDSGGDQDCLGLSLRFLLLKDWECAPSSAVTGFICERLLRLN
nr:hypothetical protein BaRGS_025858 [Batillaria attramentaria]